MRKTSSRRVRHAAVLGLGLLLGLPAVAESRTESDPLFRTDDVLEVTLSGELRAVSRDRKEVPERRPATLSYAGDDGNTVTLNVSLEPRGKSRREREVCTFPPLWVHFDKEGVKDTLFAKQKRLKMVTYCRSPESFQDYVLKEYLAYRILNRLSDASFRVRLLRVRFAEAGDDKDPLVRYGFFIEHKQRLAKRLDKMVVEPEEIISAASLEPQQAAIAEIFQYMVSNTDFSFIAPPVDDVCCHNAVLLAPRVDNESAASPAGDAPVLYLPVPYDFDRTGFVDPPNGAPAEGLGQRSFRDRVYRGFCRDPAYLEEAVQATLNARPDIDALIRTLPDLGDRSRERALRYLADYYDVVADPKRLAQTLRCRELQ